MISAFWKRLSGLRLGAMLKSLPRLVNRLSKLLEIPAPEAPQWIRRISIMERDIMLPIKAAAIAMIYSFYFTRWILVAHNELDVEVEAVEYFFWVYVGINVVVAALLIRMHRLPLALMQWVVFVIILVDGIFLSALTLVTLGYRSFLYWLFLALIVRSAVSIPRATSQILLNLTIITCYVLAGVIDISVAKHLDEQARAAEILRETRPRSPIGSRRSARSEPRPAQTRAPTNEARPQPAAAPRVATDTYLPSDWDEPPRLTLTNSAQSDNPAEPLVVRLVLLLLMTVCSYGVQVLLERQRQAAEEAREFALREGQLHSAGRLAAEFAHQIKNPLAIITNAAFSLQRARGHNNSDTAEQIQIIQEEVERSDRIITQIMGYAQLSEGRVEKLNVREEIEWAINQVFPPAAKYDVQIHRDFDAEFPPLLMLRRHLADTFVNLLQNAREALDGRSGNIFIGAHCHGDASVEVSIRDDGPGISADKTGKIFEAYYTTKEKGTGIGLATVKHNVELYGGAVHLESELGKGACFTLIFPAKSLTRLDQNT
jgi:signal transduction histidine kinase